MEVGGWRGERGDGGVSFPPPPSSPPSASDDSDFFVGVVGMEERRRGGGEALRSVAMIGLENNPLLPLPRERQLLLLLLQRGEGSLKRLGMHTGWVGGRQMILTPFFFTASFT